VTPEERTRIERASATLGRKAEDYEADYLYEMGLL
jgi:hypothetical protein